MPGRRLPMFPLGTVLLPHAHLPLHIFEPRYRALVKDVLAGDGEFGVVLIERGQEVGGGDVRFDIGTVARIVQSAELPRGRWLLEAALLSPIGPIDAQKVLEAPGTLARLALLEALLDDARDMLGRRIAEAD